MDKKSLSLEFMNILYSWRKVVIINVLIVVVTTTIITLLLKNEYKATATIMLAPESQMNLGNMAGLLSGKSTLAAIGAKALGMSNTSEDVILGIMNSRRVSFQVIDRFDLFTYYKIKEKNYDKALKALQSDLSTNVNEYNMIEVSMLHEDPQIAADIVNYIIKLTDSLNIVYNIERAKNNRIFLEKRYLQNVEDLRKAEETLYEFQKKYGIVAIPEQLEVSIKASAEIEGLLTKKEIESYFIREQFGETSPQYRGIQEEIRILRAKVHELKTSSGLGSKSNIFFSFKQMPDIAIKYLRAYRDVQIQQTILEVVMPMYEQAKVEEQKSIPSILTIDYAVPPQLKYRPKRLLIIAGVTILFLLLHFPVLIVCHRYQIGDQFLTPIEQKLHIFCKTMKKLYKI